MKKVAHLIVSLAAGTALMIGTATPAHAHTPNLGGHICKTIGGTWIRSTKTCAIHTAGTATTSFIVPAGVTLSVQFDGSLLLNPSVTIQVDGTIGTAQGGTLQIGSVTSGISIYGTFANNGSFNSAGALENNGTFVNQSTGAIALNSTGSIALFSAFTNHGSLDNAGALNSYGVAVNNTSGGVINNNSGGSITNNSGVINNDAASTINNNSGASMTNSGVFNQCGTFNQNGGSSYSGNTPDTITNC